MSMRGTYRPLDYVIPSPVNGPQRVSPAATSAAMQAGARMSQSGNGKGPVPVPVKTMSGAYGRYGMRGLGDATTTSSGFSLQSVESWISSNPLLAVGAAVVAGMILFGKRR